jgi:hypothetical protein
MEPYIAIHLNIPHDNILIMLSADEKQEKKWYVVAGILIVVSIILSYLVISICATGLTTPDKAFINGSNKEGTVPVINLVTGEIDGYIPAYAGAPVADQSKMSVEGVGFFPGNSNDLGVSVYYSEFEEVNKDEL